MKFEVDAGNTRIKWRVVDEAGGIVARGFAPSVDELRRNLASASFIDAVKKLLISSVASESVLDQLRGLSDIFLNNEGVFVARSANEMSGVTFSYEDVSRLGIDRCMAMIAAKSRCSEGVLVVDCGSAITADYVNSEGVHIGGYIVPGLSMMLRSLSGGTAKVEFAVDEAMAVLPGKSTGECVNNGVRLVAQSMGLGFIRQMREHGLDHLLITGGDGHFFANLLDQSDCYIEDLVFEGLELAASQIEGGSV